MYDSYLLKDVHSVLVNFPREYAQETLHEKVDLGTIVKVLQTY